MTTLPAPASLNRCVTLTMALLSTCHGFVSLSRDELADELESRNRDSTLVHFLIHTLPPYQDSPIRLPGDNTLAHKDSTSRHIRITASDERRKIALMLKSAGRAGAYESGTRGQRTPEGDGSPELSGCLSPRSWRRSCWYSTSCWQFSPTRLSDIHPSRRPKGCSRSYFLEPCWSNRLLRLKVRQVERQLTKTAVRSGNERRPPLTDTCLACHCACRRS